MCGLCGVLSPSLSQTQIEVFKGLLAVSVLRGDNGAGVVAVPRKSGERALILKQPYFTSAELAYSLEFHELVKEPMTCLMGHARQPTSGGVTEEDVHPHDIGHILGMHNGTMQTVANKVVGMNDNDSQLLFRAIDQYGIDYVIKNSKGAFSLTYIDKETETLCFIRNNERPMYWAIPKGENVVYWASEREFLSLVLGRKYIKEIKIYGSVPLALSTWRIRPMGKVTFTATRKLEDTPDVRSNVPAILGTYKPLVDVNTVKDVTMFQTKKGSYVTFEELRLMLATGCAYCNAAQQMVEYTKGRIHWTNSDEFVCKFCADSDPLARDYIRSHGITLPEIRK